MSCFVQGGITTYKLFYTVQEASDICDVTKTTIRNAIKHFKMKTYVNGKGVIHIYGPHLMAYCNELQSKKEEQLLKELMSYTRKVAAAKKRYLEAIAKADDCEDGPEALKDEVIEKRDELLTTLTIHQELLHILRDNESIFRQFYEVTL